MTSRRLQITLQPAVLQWARERAGISLEELARKAKVSRERVLEWERSGKISIAQADRLAGCTYTPLGLLYLTEPPDEPLPIADFRTRTDDPPPHSSPDLLETIHLMQRRQSWMRDELIESGTDPLAYIGAYGLAESPLQVAAAMRQFLNLADGWAAVEGSRTNVLELMRDRAEAAGVLVVFNGIVGNNTRRKLDPDEFQGFALVDAYAPLIFVNGADVKAAQIFTLSHELAHLFVGESGLSKFVDLDPGHHAIEQFCNEVAAEFLVPEADLRAFWPMVKSSADPYRTLARHFKVSSIVGARRALDLNLISRDAFHQFYRAYREGQPQRRSGDNFWNLPKWRIGPKFAAAVIRATKAGRLPYREAYALTGLKGTSFERLTDKMSAVSSASVIRIPTPC